MLTDNQKYIYKKFYLFKPRRIIYLAALTAALLLPAGAGPAPRRQSQKFALSPLRRAGADETEAKLTIEDFEIELQANENDDRTLIKGAKASLYDGDIYIIDSPEVTLTVEQEPGENENGEKEEEPEKVHITLTAENAELDEPNKTIRMFNNVRADGPDFTLVTESIRYHAQERRLLSNKAVEFRRYETGGQPNEDEEGKNRWLTLEIHGDGLDVRLPMQEITVGGASKTDIHRVSEHFLASETGGDRDEGAGDEPQTIIIRSDGNIIYSHLLEKINYSDNVVVTAPGRKLNTRNLEITIDRADGEEIEITRIDAREDVSFEFDGRLATGDQLEWRSITQIGKIQGKPATLTDGGMQITAGKLEFYRLSNRLRINTPGKLVWETPDEEKDANDSTADATGRPVFTSGEPIVITWEGSMVYDDNGEAKFEENVNVRQNDSELKCDTLELVFDAETNEPVSLLATDNIQFLQEEPERKISGDSLAWEEKNGVIRIESKGEERWVLVTEPARRLETKTILYDPDAGTIRCPGEGRMDIEEATSGEAASNGTPIRLRWEEDMTWDGERTAMLQGKVKAVQPGRTLEADELKVLFDEDTNPAELIARGGAVLVVTDDAPPVFGPENGETAAQTNDKEQETEEAEHNSEADTNHEENEKTLVTGKHEAVSDGGVRWVIKAEHLRGMTANETLESESAGTLTVKQKGNPEDRITWAESMLIDMNEMHAIFKGDVDADFSQTNLQCGRLRIDINENRQLRYLSARGDVNVVSPGEESWRLAAGDASAVFAANGELDHLIARENVTVIDATRMLEAEQLRLFFTYDAATGENTLERARARGSVSIRYKNGDQLRARGDRMEWESKNDKYEIEGTPAALQRGNLTIEGEKIIIDRLSGEVSLPEGASPTTTTIEGR